MIDQVVADKILAVMPPGREFTMTDIRHRMADKGHKHPSWVVVETIKGLVATKLVSQDFISKEGTVAVYRRAGK